MTDDSSMAKDSMLMRDGMRYGGLASLSVQHNPLTSS